MLENIFNNIKELKNKDSDWMDKMMTLTKRIADTDIKQLISQNVIWIPDAMWEKVGIMWKAVRFRKSGRPRPG